METAIKPETCLLPTQKEPQTPLKELEAPLKGSYGPNPEAQDSPEALHDMVFGPKNLEKWVLRGLGYPNMEVLGLKYHTSRTYKGV